MADPMLAEMARTYTRQLYTAAGAEKADASSTLKSDGILMRDED